MPDLTKVNAQVLDSLNKVQQAVMMPEVVKASGAGKAYQSVAQSAAIAIQDATDNLRNVSTISATAIGVALAKFLATKDTQYLTAITDAQKAVTAAAQEFKTIGADAAAVVSGFPAGATKAPTPSSH